jgi:hypothetical protein
MCTKIQHFACNIPNFSGGDTPGPPRREGATKCAPKFHPQHGGAMRGAQSAPGSADPDPHSYFNTPKSKILYNTLVKIVSKLNLGLFSLLFGVINVLIIDIATFAIHIYTFFLVPVFMSYSTPLVI